MSCMEVFTNVSKKRLENVLTSSDALQMTHERIIWKWLNWEGDLNIYTYTH